MSSGYVLYGTVQAQRPFDSGVHMMYHVHMTKFQKFTSDDHTARNKSWGGDEKPPPPLDVPWDEVCHPASIIVFPPEEVELHTIQRLRANCHSSAQYRGLNAKTTKLPDGGLRVVFRRQTNKDPEAIKRFGPCPDFQWNRFKENPPARWIRD